MPWSRPGGRGRGGATPDEVREIVTEVVAASENRLGLRLDAVERRLDDQQNELVSLATAFAKAGIVTEELRLDAEGSVTGSVE